MDITQCFFRLGDFFRHEKHFRPCSRFSRFPRGRPGRHRPRQVALSRVSAISLGENQRIVTGAPIEGIATVTSLQFVIAGHPKQVVVATLAVQDIVTAET